MSLDLNDAAMSGNAEEVLIRLNMGEDPNQKFYPRFISANGFSKSLGKYFLPIDIQLLYMTQYVVVDKRLSEFF